jgi:hypothetical protein
LGHSSHLTGQLANECCRIGTTTVTLTKSYDVNMQIHTTTVALRRRRGVTWCAQATTTTVALRNPVAANIASWHIIIMATNIPSWHILAKYVGKYHMHADDVGRQ